EVRRMQEHYSQDRPRTLREAMAEQFRRDAIDASHFLGLAEFYAGRGENAKALNCLDMSRAKDPVNPTLYKLRGKILARHKEFDGAARELSQALRFNPFDRELAELLGRVEYERRNFKGALDAAVQAFLLLQDGDEEGSERLRRRIRTLRQILGYEHDDLLAKFRAGRDRLEVAFDRLQWHRERFLEEGALTERGATTPASPIGAAGGLIEMAARIRQLNVFPNLSDHQIIQVAQAAREEFFERGRKVFAFGEVDDQLYLMETGSVSFERQTSYGVFRIREVKAGQLFGEEDFICRLQRGGDAVTAEPSRLIRLDSDEIRRLVSQDAELGMQLYWGFWHTLARKLRATNERLQGFFAVEEKASPSTRLRYTYPESALRVTVDSDTKIRLLQEQGLSHGELMTLATFSREKRFPADSSIFEEGDEGKEMYVILEGQARICKIIPGVGEEALAILGRGDFFGEMSLIDGEPRSAEAKAHGGPVTVLALDQATFREILAMDAPASLVLLQLLCRLLSRRLMEMNAKLVGWSILAGPQEGGREGFPSETTELRGLG
ncbi:MAG: cyclic nucleotide-binding domain-containing protein, partial [Acidobacteria bacterium]|nr:cyclic nucleotide-binding domain-containing protein [Acidobacteriota bacterium]